MCLRRLFGARRQTASAQSALIHAPLPLAQNRRVTITSSPDEPINARIEQLNKEALGTGNGLVWGGAVDEKVYRAARPRVLLLLKEANCITPDEVWGMPAFLKTQAYGTTVHNGKVRFDKIWRFVGALMAGITGNMPSFADISSTSAAYDMASRKGLAGLAVLNVRKYPGTSESDNRALLAYLREPKHLNLLLEEIRLLDPQLVICGGTYDMLSKALGNPLEKTWPSGARTFTVRKLDAVFLDFPHPSVRGVKPNVLYTYLQCAVYDLMQAQGWRA